MHWRIERALDNFFNLFRRKCPNCGDGKLEKVIYHCIGGSMPDYTMLVCNVCYHEFEPSEIKRATEKPRRQHEAVGEVKDGTYPAVRGSSE